MNEDITKMPVAEESSRGASFDARGQYYRLWMWYVAQTGAAAIEGDYSRWLRSVRQLYVHARSFLSDEERKAVEDSLSAAQKSFIGVVENDRPDAVYRMLANTNRQELEEKLLLAQSGIYDGMRRANMLIPEQSVDAGGLDIEKMFKEADL